MNPIRTPLPLDRPSVAPTFSVIVPLIEHRGMATECLAAWQRQTLPHGDCQILAVSDGSEPAVERIVLPLLRRGDHLLQEAGANRSRLYDLGARAARGRFVFFTESHCLPEPDCLEEMARFLEASGLAGACCRSIGIASTFRDRQDHLLFEEGFEVFRRDGDWRKVNVHGFALSREAYLAVGGLPHRYGGFAEMLLAAALRDHGFTLGYAQAAAVRHHYHASLAEVEQLIDYFLRGESLFRQEHPGPDRVGHSFIPYGLWTLPPDKAPLWLSLAGILARRLLWGDGSVVRMLVPALGQALKPALLTRRWRLVAPTWARWLARSRSALWVRHESRRARAYRDWGEQTMRFLRLACLLRQPRTVPLPSKGSVLVADLPDQDHVGFHVPETSQGQTYRWTGRAALVRLTPHPGARTLRLLTNGLHAQPFAALNLRVLLDGRPVPAVDVKEEPDGVTVPIDGRSQRAGVTTVALICTPIQPWKQGVADRRELGLPIFALEFRP